MKSLSPEMEICRQSRSHDIVWLAELDWDDTTGRYGSRPVTIGNSPYEPIIIGIEGLRLTLPPDRSAPPARLELVNTAELGDERFEKQAERQGLLGRTVRLGFVFLDPDVILETDDIIWIQTYRVERAQFGAMKAVLELLPSPEVAGRRLVGRKLLPTLDARISPDAVGRTIPIIFGRVTRSPLIPFRVGVRSYLRQVLEPDAETVPVLDVSLFPETGRVQIGDEVIAYAALDRDSGTLGRADSPVVRTSPAYHRSGTAVDLIPDGGFEYIAADHRCHSIGPVYADGREIEASAYSLAVEEIGGREVQKVVFPVLPSEVSYAGETSTRRIDGREDENLWAEGSENEAESPLAAVDKSGTLTAAVVSASKTPLVVEYMGDLSGGPWRYGRLDRCLLSVEYSASQRWSITNRIMVTVGRGPSSQQFELIRPPLSENMVTFPAHSHADTIRDEVADTRDLFEFAQQHQVADFDRAFSASGWSTPEQAIDGNLDSYAQNTPDGGSPETEPLKFQLLREPLGPEAVELDGIDFCARLATTETLPVMAALDVSIAGKYVDTQTVEVAGEAETFKLSVKAEGLTISDTISASSEFAVRSVDGRQVKVFGAWLELKYRPKIAGRERKASQVRTGSVASAAPTPVALPTKTYRQAFDLTALVESCGGWDFFAPEGNSRPFVRIDFGSSVDTAELRVSEIAFEVEYAPRSSVKVFDSFEATIEGIERSGELVENPADIIEWLVTNEVGLGWGQETIDSQSFDQARAWLSARAWRLSRRLGVPQPVEALLESIARESGCRLCWEAGRLRLLPIKSLATAAESVATLDKSVILARPIEKRTASAAETANVIRLRYGARYSLGGGERRSTARWLELSDAGSVASQLGRCEREYIARWHATSSAALATRLAAMLLVEAAEPTFLVELDLPMKMSHLERGDVVVIDHPSGGLNAVAGEVVAVEFVDCRYVRATVAVRIPALYCWWGDTETFIAHVAGSAEKVFVIEGERVASLDRTGRLRIAATLVEQGLGERSMAAAIEHDATDHRLYFGVGDETEGYTAVFALDQEGRLLLRGTIRERADLSSLAISTCHAADPARFVFSCDLATVQLSYEAADDRLDLTGTVVESAPV